MKTKAGNIGAVLFTSIIQNFKRGYCKMDKVKLETLHTCN